MIRQLHEFLVQLGPTLVGLAALWLAYVTATRQIRAATVSTSRQRWIDSLQDALSLFLSASACISDRVSSRYPDGGVVMQHADELHSGYARVAIMLTNDNTDHRELRNTMNDLMKAISAGLRDGKEPSDYRKESSWRSAAREAVIVAAQKVIAAEWSKIKQGG